MNIPQARDLPFEEKRTKCSACLNEANCRLFYKLPDITSIAFFCYDCFLTKRAKENYQPLLLSTSLETLILPTELEKKDSEREWYNKTSLLKMPPRAGETVRR
jgi:hypothetical protein